jgi:hypothetical protein
VSRERQLAELERRIVQLFDQLHQPVQRYVRRDGSPDAAAEQDNGGEYQRCRLARDSRRAILDAQI